ncbi:MAG: acyl-CoA dehydrogenase family protein [Candidatus Thiodiazotropha endolucinida]
MYPRDLESILEQVQRVAKGVVSENALDIDQQARWPEEGLRALQQAGIAGLTVPLEYGGLGHGSFAVAQVCELLGQECASTAMCFGMHCVGSAVLSAKATKDQQERFLHPIAAGEHLTTLSLSEAGTGSHFYIPNTRLDAISPEMYHVSGTKTFVTNGRYADSYVISTVAADPDGPLGEFSCIVVPADAEGLSWGPPWSGLGMRGNSSTSLTLDKVAIARDNLLGEEGDQIWYVFQVVAPIFLMAMTGTYLGIASAALEEARIHLLQRQYTESGTGLSQLAVVQHRLGSLWGMLERTRRLCYHAAASFDAGNPDALPTVFTAKAEVADCAVNMVNEVMTLMGGLAYRDDSRLHQLLRDARAAHVMAPTTDMLRTWTGRVLLGLPILGTGS